MVSQNPVVEGRELRSSHGLLRCSFSYRSWYSHMKDSACVQAFGFETQVRSDPGEFGAVNGLSKVHWIRGS